MTNTKKSVISEIRGKVEQLPDVTTRPMFGYQCYSVGGKFFIGFDKKDKFIVRLSKEHQLIALKNKGLKVKPFSHGAKMGWVELDACDVSDIDRAFNLVRKGYEHAQNLSEKI